MKLLETFIQVTTLHCITLGQLGKEIYIDKIWYESEYKIDIIKSLKILFIRKQWRNFKRKNQLLSVILVRLIVIEQNSALSFLIIFSLLAGGLAVSTAPHCKAWCFGPCVVFQGVSEPELSLSGQLSDPPLPPSLPPHIWYKLYWG